MALAPFLLAFPRIMTLGIRACLADYSTDQRMALRRADRVLFPTQRFVHVLDAAGKATFPSVASYLVRRSRILQCSLLAYHELPMPRTRCYYGFRQKTQIVHDFKLPLMAYGPCVTPGSSRLISAPSELWPWVRAFNPVVVQEYVPLDQRVRFVCVNYRCLAVLQSSTDADENQSFLPVETRDPVFRQILEVTLRLLEASRIDDIALEWGYGRGQWWALGALRSPAKMDGMNGRINRHEVVGRMITEGLWIG
ncbi:MAG TPA: hypothetical protein DEO88_02905 [Syntrophobacteraceae bacterium]|nr:hypothetical protein [Syntrophobacteraceae bacterium]